MKISFKTCLLGMLIVSLLQCSQTPQSLSAAVSPTIEDRLESGHLYTPSSQSFLREKHWLEETKELDLQIQENGRAAIEYHHPDEDYHFKIRNLDLSQIVPRLHYRASKQPDDFDALNLMLAEYSRNSLSVPVGKKGDEMAHFETNLEENVPWKRVGDFEFKANPHTVPIRASVINNCLAPGLWELNATDRSAEIYHAWFQYPEDEYYALVAKTNHLPEAFVKDALKWHEKEIPVDLARLRQEKGQLLQTKGTTLLEGRSGFSSQGSRRKLNKKFALVQEDGQWVPPTELSKLTEGPVRLTEFIPPGKYSFQKYREFDFTFLRGIKHATFREVSPLTHYGLEPQKSGRSDMTYLELRLELEDYTLVLGNLPLELMVPQEDFAMHGFGVGILSAAGFAERRDILIEEGPAPSFAYICKRKGDQLVAVNSHEYGLEQIFIRSHTRSDQAWLELTLSSYERIVDLVKYRVEIPQEYLRAFQKAAMSYVSPLYLTYRDDNLR